MNRKTGQTLIEIMVTLVILSLIAAAFMKLIGPHLDFFKRAQIRQQANGDARKCMETISRFLTNAKASSVVIKTPPLASPPPNSEIDFTAMDNSSTYVIKWSTSPPNSVHVLRTASGSTIPVDTIIGNNVTGLMFTGDFRDPTIVNVSLQIDVVLDNSNQDSSIYTILQTNQVVRMAYSQ